MSAPLLPKLRARGFALELRDSGVRSGPKLVVSWPEKPDETMRRRIANEASYLKLALLLEDPPQWFLRQMDLCMDPASPVKLRNLAARVAYHVGGLEGWQDVAEDVADALLEWEPAYLKHGSLTS
jgi:hypothetical protein